jgi:hypothetical protein
LNIIEEGEKCNTHSADLILESVLGGLPFAVNYLILIFIKGF